MGEWEEMAIYVDTVDSGPGGSNSPSHLAAAASMALQQQQQHPMLGSNAANALSAAATTMSTSSSTSSRSSGGFRLVGGAAAVPGPPAGGSGGAGGAASSTGAFLRAVLCIKHDQHDLAQVNIERSRGEGRCRLSGCGVLCCCCSSVSSSCWKSCTGVAVLWCSCWSVASCHHLPFACVVTPSPLPRPSRVSHRSCARPLALNPLAPSRGASRPSCVHMQR
jgi:hypothetical protein